MIFLNGVAVGSNNTRSIFVEPATSSRRGRRNSRQLLQPRRPLRGNTEYNSDVGVEELAEHKSKDRVGFLSLARRISE